MLELITIDPEFILQSIITGGGVVAFAFVGWALKRTIIDRIDQHEHNFNEHKKIIYLKLENMNTAIQKGLRKSKLKSVKSRWKHRCGGCCRRYPRPMSCWLILTMSR